MIRNYQESKGNLIEDGMTPDKIHEVNENRRMVEENRIFNANIYIKEETKR